MSSLYDDAAEDASFNSAITIDETPAASNGLGSLADELAALGSDYSEDDEFSEDDDDDGPHQHRTTYASSDDGTTTSTSPIPLSHGPTDDAAAAAAKRPTASLYSAAGSSDYDSDAGDDALTEPGGITVGLEEKLAAMERMSLQHRGLLRDEDAADAVVPRLMDGLQNLQPQSALESAASRLTNTHAALSAHVLNQTRTLRDLSFAIAAGALPPPETADLLLGLLEAVPRPAALPLQELSALHHMTLGLVSQLSFLSDSLHMARQSTIAASRKLRVAREACADWRAEIETVDKAHRWIEDGDWDTKLRRRDAAFVCKDVTSGFEEVCRGFEEKLRAQEVATTA